MGNCYSRGHSEILQLETVFEEKNTDIRNSITQLHKNWSDCKVSNERLEKTLVELKTRLKYLEENSSKETSAQWVEVYN